MNLVWIIVVIPVSVIFSNYFVSSVFSEPFLYDKSLKVETVYDGLSFPSSMSFLGKDDILVLEKNNGTVNRIINGQMLDEPLLKVDVDFTQERGLLGSAVKNNSNGTTNVFLYFTELKNNENVNHTDSFEKSILGNRVFQYDFVNGELINPRLLYEIPFNREPPYHIGGKMVIGPDKNLYIAVGDLLAKNAITQNFRNGTAIDGSGGIIRIDLEGGTEESIFEYPGLDKYYAYGIRNSFGMDFDPVTGKLWNTENGPGYGDEINLVEPGFNSGWKKVQGLWKPVDEFAGDLFTNVTDLTDFDQVNSYQYPKLTWAGTIGITALKFLNSSNFGEGYFGDIFVGDFNKGDIYHFELNENRSTILDDSSMISEVEIDGANHSVIYQDPFSNCFNFFECIVTQSTSITDNSKENQSLSLSTTLSKNFTWSWVYGREYGVTEGNNYTISTTFGQNENGVSSHISLQGFNKNSQLWEEILQCPSGISGFLRVSTFQCDFVVPNNVSKIQPIINAGWSTGDNKTATTVFHQLQIHNKENGESADLLPKVDPLFPVIGRGFGHITDIQQGPDGNLYVLTINPQGGVDFDHSRGNQGLDGVIYKISKK